MPTEQWVCRIMCCGATGCKRYYVILVDWKMAYVREMTKEERIEIVQPYSLNE